MGWTALWGLGLLLMGLLTGCQSVTASYQKMLFGTTFQPGTPCTTAQVWDGRMCLPKTKGAS
jgi:hypothetical protein